MTKKQDEGHEAGSRVVEDVRALIDKIATDISEEDYKALSDQFFFFAHGPKPLETRSGSGFLG